MGRSRRRFLGSSEEAAPKLIAPAGIANITNPIAKTNKLILILVPTDKFFCFSFNLVHIIANNGASIIMKNEFTDWNHSVGTVKLNNRREMNVFVKNVKETPACSKADQQNTDINEIKIIA